MIEKTIEQQEVIKGMQENEESAIKIMKMYEDYKLRVDKAIEYINKNQVGYASLINCTIPIEELFTTNMELLNILKGEDKE